MWSDVASDGSDWSSLLDDSSSYSDYGNLASDAADNYDWSSALDSAFNDQSGMSANDWSDLLNSTDYGSSATDYGSGLGDWSSLLDSASSGGSYGGSSSGGFFDNLLGGIGDSFKKNPWGTIAAGLGILSKIKDMRSNGGGAAAGDMAGMIQAHLASPQGGGGGGMVGTFPSAASPGPGAMIAIPQIQPTYVGPLTDTFYRGKK